MKRLVHSSSTQRMVPNPDGSFSVPVVLSPPCPWPPGGVSPPKRLVHAERSRLLHKTPLLGCWCPPLHGSKWLGKLCYCALVGALLVAFTSCWLLPHPWHTLVPPVPPALGTSGTSSQNPSGAENATGYAPKLGFATSDGVSATHRGTAPVHVNATRRGKWMLDGWSTLAAKSMLARRSTLEIKSALVGKLEVDGTSSQNTGLTQVGTFHAQANANATGQMNRAGENTQGSPSARDQSTKRWLLSHIQQVTGNVTNFRGVATVPLELVNASGHVNSPSKDPSPAHIHRHTATHKRRLAPKTSLRVFLNPHAQRSKDQRRRSSGGGSGGGATSSPVPRQQGHAIDRLRPEKAQELQALLAACKGSASSALRQHFQDTVLILDFPTQARAESHGRVLRDLYSRVFGAVELVSERANQSLGVQAASEWYPDPQHPLTGTSLYHYLALPFIIEMHPYASGFLWARDDVIVPYWALVTASKARVWWGESVEGLRKQQYEIDPPMKGYRGSFSVQYKTVQYGSLQDKTGYSREGNGVQGVSGEGQGLGGGTWVYRPAFRNQVSTALSLLPSRLVRQYVASCEGRKGVFHRASSSLFYLPRSHAPRVADALVPALRKAQVVGELAVPLMLLCLVHPKHFVEVQTELIGDRQHWKDKLPIDMSQASESSHTSQEMDPLLQSIWSASDDGTRRMLERIGSHDGCVSKVSKAHGERSQLPVQQRGVTTS